MKNHTRDFTVIYLSLSFLIQLTKETNKNRIAKQILDFF
jgi:hypothetical protein